jgi:dTDP-4-dehydrorhamnose reductase
MILLTGGSGLLGQELQRIMPVWAPPRAEFDVTNKDSLHKQELEGVSLIIHAAGYTDVRRAELNKHDAYQANVCGTLNVARLGIPLVYISTEYVFDGALGDYREGDPVSPCNYYSVTKALGEVASRAAPSSLVIRCSFKPRPFEHPRAFVDQWTSGDYVDVMAPIIADVIAHRESFGQHDTLHIGTGRKCIYDLARQSRDVEPLTRAELLHLRQPRDTSLNTSRWEAIRNGGA